MASTTAAKSHLNSNTVHTPWRAKPALAGTEANETGTSSKSARSPAKASASQTPWWQRPYLTMQTAGEIAGLSPASLYRFAAEGRLVLKKLGGRTLVDTPSLENLIATATPWTPSERGVAARAAREPRAAQARA